MLLGLAVAWALCLVVVIIMMLCADHRASVSSVREQALQAWEVRDVEYDYNSN